jgi:hypothetical protein
MSNEQVQSAENVSIDYDPTQVSAPQHRSNQVGKIPDEASKMAVKLIPDLLDPTRATTGILRPYWAVTEHMHEIGVDGNGKAKLRSHACQKNLGFKTCPECDKYYELNPLLKAVGEATIEGKQLKSKLERLNPRQKGWVYFVTPAAESIKALKLPKEIINQLWGKPKSQYREAVESLVNKMIKLGLNPYDLKSPIGWMLLWKTGEGFSTRYFADIAQKQTPRMEEGRCRGVDIAYEEHVLSELVLKFPANELPDFRKMQFKNAFTPGESAAFAANPMITPARILNGENSYEAEGDTEDGTVGQAMSNPSISATPPDLDLPFSAGSDDINKFL